MTESTGASFIARGRTVVVDRTLIMGVINASPESFSDGAGRFDATRLLDRAGQMVEDGADILDIGGQSSVTNDSEITEAEELRRVLPLVQRIAAAHPGVLISVDTYRPNVARGCLEAGAHIINDVSGLRYPMICDPCRELGAALVIMHTVAAPKQRLQRSDLYPDVVSDVADFLASRMAEAMERGVPRDSLILDPGPDFSKTPHQTLAVLRGLDVIRGLDRPLLLALSRKDFLGAILRKKPRGRDAGTLAAIAFLIGSSSGQIIRVHDVAAARDVVMTVEALSGRLDIDPEYILPDALRYER